ncbi:MAG TPA: bifunctional demethylmenaquinone methyltransferase/2-methoxy-6-polyprenyl-1,4-benzoquinol methylase UbiE [Blastocatellia bacterium]|nr:bifunctional demethylmenaquinone methyltransferase/2-methoxy-6-polyprenyl-1,4-benzoquinol methylase UbiE [Blastocatellia bacterium]
MRKTEQGTNSTCLRAPDGQGKPSEQVKQMFASIARRYDLLNHLLSLTIDRRWRRMTRKKIRAALTVPGARVLDLCSGTADLALELAAEAPVIGLDFCHPMLLIGQRKIARRRASVDLVEGDALRLPFGDNLFTAVTIAFGLRNLESAEDGLREMFRVLRPGGLVAVLEFSRLRLPVVGQLYGFYFKHVVPRVGTMISGVSGPYQYLYTSVQSFFDPASLADLMRQVGFHNVRYQPFSGGIVTLHLGEKRA